LRFLRLLDLWATRQTSCCCFCTVSFRVAVIGVTSKTADCSTDTAFGRLRPHRERPSGRRAAEQGDELAPLHVWMAPAWQEKM